MIFCFTAGGTAATASSPKSSESPSRERGHKQTWRKYFPTATALLTSPINQSVFYWLSSDHEIELWVETKTSTFPGIFFPPPCCLEFYTAMMGNEPTADRVSLKGRAEQILTRCKVSYL